MRKAATEAVKKALKQGEEKGLKEAKAEVVRNLLSLSKFSMEEIANFANVSEFFVRKVKKEWN